MNQLAIIKAFKDMWNMGWAYTIAAIVIPISGFIYWITDQPGEYMGVLSTLLLLFAWGYWLYFLHNVLYYWLKSETD